MNIALIQPKLGGDKGIGGGRGFAEPMGLAYLAAVLDEAGHETLILQQIYETDDEIIERTSRFEPDVICISSMTHNFPRAGELAKLIKNEIDDLPIIIGGDHVSGDPLSAFQYPFDFVVVGEGEEVVIKLINYLNNGSGQLDDILGLCFLKNGKPKFTGRAELIKDIDSLPFPKREGLPIDKYKHFFLGYPPPSKQRAFTLHTARGCRFKCDYCTTAAINRGSWRARSAENVLDEIEILVDKWNPNLIVFSDEDLFGDSTRVAEIVQGILDRGFKFRWRSMLNPIDVVRNKETIRLMRASGYEATILGVESLSKQNLKSVNRSVMPKTTFQALEILNELKISIRVAYIVGYLEETLESLSKDLLHLIHMPIDEIYFSFLTAFPGTPLYDKSKAMDLFISRDLFEMDCCHVTLRTKVEKNELYRIRDRFLNEFQRCDFRIKRLKKKICQRSELAEPIKEIYGYLYPDTDFDF